MFHFMGIEFTETEEQMDYIDGTFHLGGELIGVEIKDRRDGYFSSSFNDVICERHKLQKFLYEKDNPEFAKHKGIRKLYVINLYKDSVIWMGDIQSGELTKKRASLTTEFSNNTKVIKHIVSIPRRWGFKWNEDSNGDGLAFHIIHYNNTEEN